MAFESIHTEVDMVVGPCTIRGCPTGTNPLPAKDSDPPAEWLLQ